VKRGFWQWSFFYWWKEEVISNSIVDILAPYLNLIGSLQDLVYSINPN